MSRQENQQFPKLPNISKISDHVHAYIIHSSWHSNIIDKMLAGSLETLQRYGISNIEIVSVSGTFEIPQMISQIIKSAYSNHMNKDNGNVKYLLFVALGIVIQGETYHDKVISYSVANALQTLAITYPFIPIGFGILTVYNRQQAVERAFGKSNKGVEATLAAITQLDRIVSFTIKMDNQGRERS